MFIGRSNYLWVKIQFPVRSRKLIAPQPADAVAQRSGALAAPMEPEAVAREALSALGKGPVHVAGTRNRLAATLVRRLLSTRRRIRLISDATRRMYA